MYGELFIFTEQSSSEEIPAEKALAPVAGGTGDCLQPSLCHVPLERNEQKSLKSRAHV
jgi:hypothetical protein